MRKSFLQFVISLIFVVACFQTAFSQDTEGVSVNNVVFCTAVEDRQPTGADTVFANNVERVYCYSEFTSASGSDTVYHVWYRNGEEKARVELKIKSTRWRTWSSKRIPTEWAGDWRVDIVSVGDVVLGSYKFTVSAVSDAGTTEN